MKENIYVPPCVVWCWALVLSQEYNCVYVCVCVCVCVCIISNACQSSLALTFY